MEAANKSSTEAIRFSRSYIGSKRKPWLHRFLSRNRNRSTTNAAFLLVHFITHFEYARIIFEDSMQELIRFVEYLGQVSISANSFPLPSGSFYCTALGLDTFCKWYSHSNNDILLSNSTRTTTLRGCSFIIPQNRDRTGYFSRGCWV